MAIPSLCRADSPEKIGFGIYQDIKGLKRSHESSSELFATGGLLRGRTNLSQDNKYKKDWIIFHPFTQMGLSSATSSFLLEFVIWVGSKSACTGCSLELDRFARKREGPSCGNH